MKWERSFQLLKIYHVYVDTKKNFQYKIIRTSNGSFSFKNCGENNLLIDIPNSPQRTDQQNWPEM